MAAGMDVAQNVAPLFAPFSCDGLSLRNRIVMAPMTRKRSPGGVPGPQVAAYYRQRAENGVGLIITEGTLVPHLAAGGDVDVPRLYGADAISAWRLVVEGVHDAGARIVPQLWHVGMLRPRSGVDPRGVLPVGPSGLVRHGVKLGEPMSDSETGQVIEAFATAAETARQVGFDGIELHGAHGYLIDQYFWSQTNQRHDRYGGDIAGRTRFAAEIVGACRRRVGPRFPIVLRYSQWKLQDYAARLVTTPIELEQFLQPLVDAGVDLFHCSTRYFWQPEFDGSDLNLAQWTKKISGRPVIMVGAVGQRREFLDRAHADVVPFEERLAQVGQLVADGAVDLVAIGRALLADSAWLLKIRHGLLDQIRPFKPEALANLG